MNNPEAFFLSYLMMFSLSVLLLLHCKHSPLRPHLNSVFEILRSEARVMEGLRSLLIDTPFIHDILKLNVQPSDSDYAVDIRNSAINVRNQVIIPHFSFGQTVRVKVFFFFCHFLNSQWINNLEADHRYSSWPSNVQELLRPTFPGVIRQIRKNFHNLVNLHLKYKLVSEWM